MIVYGFTGLQIGRPGLAFKDKLQRPITFYALWHSTITFTTGLTFAFPAA